MSNLDKALQIMSDYWDAAYCEGNTGINQSLNANDCLHRMCRIFQAHDGEVVYQMQDSETFEWFGVPKAQYEHVPGNKRRTLYTAPPRVVVDEEMVDRACKALFIKTSKHGRDGMRDALKAALEKTDAS